MQLTGLFRQHHQHYFKLLPYVILWNMRWLLFLYKVRVKIMAIIVIDLAKIAYFFYQWILFWIFFLILFFQQDARVAIKHIISTKLLSHVIAKKGVCVPLSTEPQNLTVAPCAQLLKTLGVDQKHNRSKNINNSWVEQTVRVQQKDAFQVWNYLETTICWCFLIEHLC